MTQAHPVEFQAVRVVTLQKFTDKCPLVHPYFRVGIIHRPFAPPHGFRSESANTLGVCAKRLDVGSCRHCPHRAPHSFACSARAIACVRGFGESRLCTDRDPHHVVVSHFRATHPPAPSRPPCPKLHRATCCESWLAWRWDTRTGESPPTRHIDRPRRAALPASSAPACERKRNCCCPDIDSQQFAKRRRRSRPLGEHMRGKQRQRQKRG